jgi:hypothetical protein
LVAHALDYAPTNVLGTLLPFRSSPSKTKSLLLRPPSSPFVGPDLLKHLESDVRARLDLVDEFQVDPWWPDPARDGAS